jgi:hypothetical protein
MDLTEGEKYQDLSQTTTIALGGASVDKLAVWVGGRGWGPPPPSGLGGPSPPSRGAKTDQANTCRGGQVQRVGWGDQIFVIWSK